MQNALLLYEPLPERGNPWLHLLQQQAVVAAARALLAGQEGEEAGWSGHHLLAPRHMDILPLLALAAQDFARFAEPEGLERATAPIVLYDDQPWPPDGIPAEDATHLVHPAWFTPMDQGLFGAVRAVRPAICVSVVSAARTHDVLERLGWSFERGVYFEALSAGEERRPELPSRFVAADARLDGLARGSPVQGMWAAMLGEGVLPELEPFAAFGPAVEMAIWPDDEARRHE